MRDEKGADFKILCVALGDPNQAHIERLDQIRPHRLVEIEHFFETYKLLEDKTVEVLGWRDRDRALEILRADRAAWERETGRASDAGTDRRRGDPYAGIPGRRIFVAVPVAPAAREAVERLVAGVRAAAAPGEREVRWVRLDGLHVTLRFIGPTLGATDPDCGGCRCARRRPAGAPFEVGLAGAGAFPDPVRPRALWLGIGAGAAELAALTVAVDRELASRGWPPEDRPFRPHLTLARSDGIGVGRTDGSPADRGRRRPGRPLDRRPARPVRERDRWRAGPLRAARGGRPLGRRAVGLAPTGRRVC